MAVIVPCITTADEVEFSHKIKEYGAFTTRLHIDVSDGEFAPNALVPPSKMTYDTSKYQVDIHAMVAHPSKYVDDLLHLRPRMIVFHAEAAEPLGPIMDKVKAAKIKVGLALLRPTVPKTVTPLIEKADHVMIFSGDLGKYGGKASMMQLEKVRLIRMIHPEVEIGWDGGASMDNAFSLSQGDVDIIYVGGAIGNHEDPAAAYKELTDEIGRHAAI